jgi:hypothetical protein
MNLDIISVRELNFPHFNSTVYKLSKSSSFYGWVFDFIDMEISPIKINQILVIR